MSSGGGGWIELVGAAAEVVHDGLLEAVGVLLDEGYGLSEILGCLLHVASSLEDHSEPFIAIGDTGVADEELVSSALGFVEPPRVDEVYDGV